jgi:hypothetical protein
MALPRAFNLAIPVRTARALTPATPGGLAIWVLALTFACLGVRLHAAPASGDSPRTLDALDDPASWQVVASEGVELRVSAVEDPTRPGGPGRVLRLDYDFTSGAGFAGIRRPLALPLDANYKLTFHLRGDLPPNDLELKLIDASGDNVWWHNRREFAFPRDWTPLVSRRRHVTFAWGPSSAPLGSVGAVELVVASRSGGRGSLFLSDLVYRPLPVPTPADRLPAPVVHASSTADGFTTDALWITQPGDPAARRLWAPAPGQHHATLTIDLGSSREFGGLTLTWPAETSRARPARRITLSASEDARTWTTLRRIDDAAGLTTHLVTPDAQARWLRLDLAEPLTDSAGPALPPGLERLEIHPVEWSASPNDVAAHIARAATPGLYPKAIRRQTASFWTVVGLPRDPVEALINEEGQIEIDTRGFSIEPFVHLADDAGTPTLLTWADARHSQTLEGGWLPLPVVTRTYSGVPLRLTIAPAAHGTPGDSTLSILYTLENTGPAPLHGDLLLAIRPFQVNPPWQFLNHPGGVAQVRELRRDGHDVLVNAARRVAFLSGPARITAATAAQGDIIALLAANRPRRDLTALADPDAGASALAEHPFRLRPGEALRVAVAVPLHSDRDPRPAMTALAPGADPVTLAQHARRDAIDAWSRRFAHFELDLPAEGRRLADALRANLAYILINADGPGFQPGSRSYERSWIRDGSMTSSAMLEFGFHDEVRDFITWYAPYQFPSGKVPCVVDRRGPDPVTEHDSHGQLIFAIAQYTRITGDLDTARRLFPHVIRAVDYIRSQRDLRLTPEFTDPAPGAVRAEPGKPPVPLAAFRGIMPESISHEGYSANPMHSYWDNFFSLRGLSDAVDLARALGSTAQAEEWGRLRDQFRASLHQSIRTTVAAHAIDYIPGCVELGDFDPTSTTVALWPGRELHHLPPDLRALLDSTFERAWRFFLQRRDADPSTWADYTPYELRLVGAMAILGHPRRAHEMLRWYLLDQLPPGWLHWAEIVHADRARPAWIGDMPHTWVGSDFVNAVRTLIVWENDALDALELFPAVPDHWYTDPQGMRFANLFTARGQVSASVRPDSQGSDLLIRVTTGPRRPLVIPSGGIIVRLRPDVPARGADGAELLPDARSIRIRALPAEVRVRY